MSLSRSFGIVLSAGVIGGAVPALAGSTVAEGNYERIQQAWDKAEAAGGYGVPFVFAPRAPWAGLAEAGEPGRAAATTATARKAS